MPELDKKINEGRKQLKKLIKNSKAIAEKSKEVYLRMLDLLPENRMLELLSILNKEVEGLSAIESTSKAEKSDLNKRYIEEIGEFFKKEQKSAMDEEEKEEKEKAQDILKELENL